MTVGQGTPGLQERRTPPEDVVNRTIRARLTVEVDQCRRCGWIFRCEGGYYLEFRGPDPDSAVLPLCHRCVLRLLANEHGIVRVSPARRTP
jgi:hypothetical protein